MLRRFLDVCNAVEYAHSRGVLHRDIKPGNIIIGKHGETLVVDWGLAKAKGRGDGALSEEQTLVPSSSSGSAETLPGQALGTPAYMSPEQARGDLNSLGPRSDVYSLGATLYCLLTGKPPFEGDVADVLRAVQRGEFAAPRRLDRSIDAALEAVCLKAMATDPSGRYESARALAEDVERWMADEPVTAWREPWWRRERRWLVRHRALVGGLLIALPTVIVSLLLIVAHERRTNRTLGESNQELAAARAAADGARVRAEGRENLALKAIDNYRDVVEKNPDLLTRPDLKALRNRLLEAPHDFYRQLKEALEREKVERGATVSDLDDKLMGVDFALAWLNAESGTQAEALKSYGEAAAILEPLVRRINNPNQRRNLAMVYNNLGNVLIEVGRFDEARATHEKALALREGLCREQPDQVGPLWDLSYSEHNLGWLDSKVGRSESAIAHYSKAIELREEVVRRSPQQVWYGGELAKSLGNLGWMLGAVGRKDEGRASYRRGIALLEPLVAAQPNVVSSRVDLAQLLRSYGELAGESAEARDCFAKAAELGEAIVAEAPTVPRFRSDLAITLMLAGSLDRKWREFDDAIAAQRRAVALGEALARDFPEVVQFRNDFANSLVHLGLTLVDADLPAEALPHYERAKEVYAGVVRANPQDIAAVSLLAGCFNNRGLALAKLGRHEEAVGDYREAIARERDCLDRDPLSAQYRTWLGFHYMNLGKSLRALGRKDEALIASRERFELLRRSPPEQRDEGIHYHVVCDMAQLIPVVGGGKPDAELTDAERAERRAYGDRAVEEFRLTLADGFSDIGLFVRDTDLDPIRDRPDFHRLLFDHMDRTFPDNPFAGRTGPPTTVGAGE